MIACGRCERSPARHRREHGERVLCDRCAATPGDFPASTYDGLDAEVARVDGETVQEGNPHPQRGSSPLSSLVSCTGSRDGEEAVVPRMRELLEDWRAQRLDPVPVRLGEMPRHARPRHRGIAGDMALRMGLMRADGDDRPLPYACSEAVRAGHAANNRQANDAIQWLVRHGVIRGAGALRPREGVRYGTRLYRPPVEGGSVPVEVPDRPAVEPVGEGQEQPVVGGAVPLAGGRAEGAATAGDGAGAADGLVGHGGDSSPGRDADGTPRLGAERTLTAEEFIEAVIAEFDAIEVDPEEDARDDGRGGPCPYPSHRSSDWRTGAGGRWTCGVCHPAPPGVPAVRVEAAP